MKSSEMKKATKRILAMLLCTSMVLSSGVSASADEGMAAAQEQGHVHTEACYEKQNTGNLICTKAEVMEGHVHGDECYDTTPKLTCEQEEHSHDDGCYTTETKDVCNDESEEHTCGDACVETEEVLTCTAEEHSHNDGCYETETNLICGQEEVEAHIHNDECYACEEKLVCTLSETAPIAEEAAAQETVTEQPKEDKKAEEAVEAEEVNLQNDDETGIKVSVKSTSDVIPEDTKVVVAPMEMDEEHETALTEAVSEFEVLGYTAYDISLKDAEDEDITLGENKVEVAIDFEELIPEEINAEEVKDVVLVHITTDEEEKLTAETVGTVEITEEKATVEFEADSFSPYVVTYLSEAEETVEEVAVEDITLTYTSEDEAYTATVTAAPEVLENVTAFEAVPVTDEEKITALTEQLTAKAAEAQKTSLGFENYEFKFLDAEGNEVSVNGEVKVSLSFAEERIPEAATAENVDAVDAALLKTGTDDKGEAVLEEINGLVSAEAGAVKEVVYTTEAPEELILAWSGDVYRTLPNYEDDEVVITLAGTEYALQNVVGFNVTPIKEDNEETKEQYAEVAQQLEEKIAEENEANEEEKEVVGFLAYDITLVDAEGNELEPQSGVRVSMEYKEAAAPEAVAEVEEAEVTIHHFEEDEKGEVKQIVDMVAEETIEAEVTTTENAEVEKAEFVTDSFSTYTITWTAGNDNDRSISGTIVTLTGTEINVTEDKQKITLNDDADSNVIDINAIKQNADFSNSITVSGETYVFDKVVICQGNSYSNAGAIEVTSINYVKKDGRGEYRANNNENFVIKIEDSENIVPEYSLYFVYLKAGTIATVDSRAANINIDVFDYSRFNESLSHKKVLRNVNKNGTKDHSLWFATNGYEKNKPDYNVYTGDGNGPRQGFVKNNLIGGVPVMKQSGESLGYLFDVEKGYDANYLFTKEGGYYEYRSTDHFAELDTSTGNFTVYENTNLGFFPFNKVGDEILIEEARSGTVTNHHFGMHVDFTFMQPKAGIVDEQHMIFDFSGDDDVWVFIDGMLVLDLGGIHPKTGGSIDFSTGKVDYDYARVADSTIQEMYVKAIMEARNINESDAKLIANEYFVQDGKNYVFKDYSQHKLDFFYLERGAYNSNCEISFNLISVPEGPIWVEKEITKSNMADFADAVFSFKIETSDFDTETSKYSERSPLGERIYNLYEVNGSDKKLIAENLITDKDGVFVLKHHQRAEFTDIPATTKYWVTELGVESDKYEQVQFNETVIKNEKGEEFGNGNFSTGELKAQECMYVKFQNQCNAYNHRNLVINKVMADESEGGKFAVKVQYADGLKKDGDINWVDYEGEYHLGSSTGEAKTAKDGIIDLVAGGPEVYIVGLISDTKYRVFEVLNSDQQSTYATPAYSGDGDVETKTEAGKVITYITDIIELDKSGNYTATVTNSLLKKVNINKVWGDEDYSNKTRPNAIQFKLQYSDGTNSPQDVLEKSASAEVELIPLNITLSESTSTAETKTVKIAEQEMKINLKYTSWGVEISGLSGNYIYSALEENVVGYKASYSPDDNGNIKITNTLDWYIVKQSASVDETTGAREPLPGAEFELRSAKTNKVYYGTSDNNGVVKWYSVKQNQNEAALISKFPDGEYTLKETKAPSNYMLSETEYKVVVDNGFPTVTVDLNPYKNVELIQTKGNDNKVTKQQVNIYVYNTCLYELPSTGGHGIYTTMLSGFALMLGAAYVWFTSRREESSNN